MARLWINNHVDARLNSGADGGFYSIAKLALARTSQLAIGKTAPAAGLALDVGGPAAIGGNTTVAGDLAASGSLGWGGGNLLPSSNDVPRKSMSNVWTSGDQVGERASPDVGTWLSRVAGDANYRHIIHANGRQEWGDGTNARDTNLYRAAANVLQTDDKLIAGGGLGANKSMGLLAVYDSIS